MYETAKNAKKFTKHLLKLPDAAMPRFVENKWLKPEFSLRKIAELRKRAIDQGLNWSLDRPRKPEKFPFLKPLKGHKRMREQHVLFREAKLKIAAERQPEVVREYRERTKMRARNVQDFVLDEIFLDSRERKIKLRTLPDAQKITVKEQKKIMSSSSTSNSSNSSKREKNR
jgi:hypothetical protein